MKTNVAALSLEVSKAWLESPVAGLRPLASVIRKPDYENEGRGALRDLAVGDALIFDWPEAEETTMPAAWLTCPVCGASMMESSLRRVGPACSLCPSCEQVLPF